MLAAIIGSGLGLLIGSAVLIGQRRGQDQAWRAIGHERRRLHDVRRALEAIADELTEEGLRLQEWEMRLAVATDRARRSGEADLERT